MYLKTIRLRNWQNHKDSTIALGPVTILVAEPGDGKTALHRAIYAAQALPVPDWGGESRPGDLNPLVANGEVKANIDVTYSDGFEISTELKPAGTGRCGRSTTCTGATNSTAAIPVIRAHLGYHPIASDPTVLHRMGESALAEEFARLCNVQTDGSATAAVARLRRELPTFDELVTLPIGWESMGPDGVLAEIARLASEAMKAAEAERKAQAALARADLPSLPDEADRVALVAQVEEAEAATRKAEAEEIQRKAEKERQRKLLDEMAALECAIGNGDDLLARNRAALKAMADPPMLLPMLDLDERESVARRLDEADRELAELRRRQEATVRQQREHGYREIQRAKLQQMISDVEMALAVPLGGIDPDPERQATERLKEATDSRKGLRVEALRNRWADLSKGIEETLTQIGEVQGATGAIRSHLLALEQQHARLASGICPLCGGTEHVADKAAELATAIDGARVKLTEAEAARDLLEDNKRQAERERADVAEQGKAEKARGERLEAQIRNAQQELQTIQRNNEQAQQVADHQRAIAETSLRQAQLSLTSLPALPAPEHGLAERLALEIIKYDDDRGVVARVLDGMDAEAERIRRHNEQAAPQRAVWEERKAQAELAIAADGREQEGRRARMAEIAAMPKFDPTPFIDRHEAEQEQAAREALCAWDAAMEQSAESHRAVAEAETLAALAKGRKGRSERLVAVAHKLRAELLAEATAPLTDLIRPWLPNGMVDDLRIDRSGGGWKPVADVTVRGRKITAPLRALSAGQWAEVSLPLAASAGALHGAAYRMAALDLNDTSPGRWPELIGTARRMVESGALSQVVFACHVLPEMDLDGVEIVRL